MHPDLELAKQQQQQLLESASHDRLAQQAKKRRGPRRPLGLFTKLLRNPEASAASAAQCENSA